MKLNTGDAFPSIELLLPGGRSIRVPDGLGAGYRVILFYRGH